MERSSLVISIGAVCFGVAIGFITYRTLVRKGSAAITDIASVIAAIGGGTVTTWFDQSGGDSFGYYSMGLLGGMALYYLQFAATNKKDTMAALLTSGKEDTGAGIAPVDAQEEARIIKERLR